MDPEDFSFSNASLYIGDLHPETTEAILVEKFSSVGPVLSTRVCRDRFTQRSLGYAYVNFQSPQHAEEALETMNFDLINGRPIRIMKTEPDPSVRLSGAGNVFLKNLGKNIQSRSLYDSFSEFGKILSCKVATDEKGNSKGFGFIRFETEEVASKFIEAMNGKFFNGTKVYVGKFIPRAKRELLLCKEGRRHFTNVYIKNFDDYLDDEKLREMFEEYGTIKSAKVMRSEDGISKGFGFVCFDNPESAEKAVEGKNGKELHGKQLYVGRAQKRAERDAELRRKFRQLKSAHNKGHSVNLYVKNLDDCIDDKRLREEFLRFGTITSAKVMRDAKNNSRGFGFVCLTSLEGAARALTEMNGRLLVSKPLYVAVAQKKEERRKLLASQFAQSMQRMRSQPPLGQVFQPDAAVYTVPALPQTQETYFPQQMVVHGVPPYWGTQPFLIPEAEPAARLPMKQVPPPGRKRNPKRDK